MSVDRDGWEPGVVHLRVTDKDAISFLIRANCWNRSRYIEARRVEYFKQGQTIEVISQQEYEKGTNP